MVILTYNVYDMFTYLTEQGYNVIYKRPVNKEFTIDENEINSVYQGLDIRADVEELEIYLIEIYQVILTEFICLMI